MNKTLLIYVRVFALLVIRRDFSEKTPLVQYKLNFR